MKKVKPCKAYSDEWHKVAYTTLLSHLTVFPCGKCNYPVIDGYCCTTCGDEDPDTRTVDIYTGEPLDFELFRKR